MSTFFLFILHFFRLSKPDFLPVFNEPVLCFFCAFYPVVQLNTKCNICKNSHSQLTQVLFCGIMHPMFKSAGIAQSVEQLIRNYDTMAVPPLKVIN